MGLILVADDHTIVRQVLCARFEDLGFEIAAEAKSFDEAVSKAKTDEVSIVVMDYEMPGGDALLAIREIKEFENPPSILVVTSHEESEIAALCLRSGADGYLCKTATQDELRTAMLQMKSGGKYVNSEMTILLATLTDADSEPLNSLSDRELEVMKSIARGKTVTEISKALGLSVKTISTYRTRLLRKLSCKTNADLMRLALREGLVLKLA